MKLTKVQVTNFHSIRDSTEFDIGDITCLVGKNEAGKTALLQAMYRLRPILSGDVGYSVTDDYPRRDVGDYEHKVEHGEREHAIVAKLTYELADDDVESVAEVFGAAALNSKTMTLSKCYEQKGVTFDLQVDEAAALQHLLGTFSVTDELRGRLAGCKTAKDVKEATKGAEQTEAVKNISGWADKIIKAGNVSLYIFNDMLYERVPRFMYFDEYYQMTGCDSIEALKGRFESKNLRKTDHPLLGLIRLARLDLEALLNPKRTRELKNKLEGAGNHLTASIVKYWSQNRHLQMRFDVREGRPEDPAEMRSGTNIWAEIYDTQHQVTTELGSRSRGFVWFFSFLAWYGDVQREKQNVILLLDEPGLSLHGKAQGDLLRYFESELKPNHQVIYTTHSPFMVDATRFDRVRIVQDRSVESVEPLPAEAEGTKVTSDVLEATDDSLFPLQGALGYDLTQTLFVGPNSLIVEGVSDLLYLQAMSGLLQMEGRVGLLPDWTITPVGGADKVPTFVALLGAQKALNLVTLIDFQAKDQQTIENLWRRKLIERTNVLTFASFVQKPEADIEDMFGDELYLRFVNGEYQAVLAAPVRATDIGAQLTRVLVRLKRYFAAHAMAKGTTFNHYRPARYMIEQVGEMRKHMGAEVLDRFEAMFRAINELLRRA